MGSTILKMPTLIGSDVYKRQEYRRLMEGAIQPRLSDVDLSQVLTQQLFQYYDSLTEAGIALEVELEEHLHYATDPELWERLLQNMLSNVLKHGKEQARLTLTSDADTIRVELRNIVQQPVSYTHLTVHFQ